MIRCVYFSSNGKEMISFYGKDFRKVITWKKFSTKEDYVEFVDEFIEKANMEENDYYIGFCRDDVLDFYYPAAGRPDRTWHRPG